MDIVTKTVTDIIQYDLGPVKLGWVIAGLIVLLFILSIIVKIKSMFRKLHSNPKSKLTMEEKRYVALSAVYGEQLGAYTDDLKTDVATAKIYAVLEQYGVDAFSKKEKAQQIRTIVDDFLADGEHKGEYSAQNIELLKQFPRIQGVSQAAQIDTFAWYIGRAAMLVRFGFDLGAFSREEAFEYLSKAYFKAVNHYDDWTEYGIAYVAGRMDWNNDAPFHDVFVGYVQNLLSDSRSPWLKISFK